MPTDPAPGDDFALATAGVILAGGKSRRFGGNKALARYHGRPLVAHVAAVLEKIFAERLLVTNTPADYAFVGWPMTGDLILNAGPLAGIQAALRHIATPRAFVVACDMPRLNGEIIRRLCRCPGDWDVILPATAVGAEPLHAVYHRRVLPVVEAALGRGEGKIGQLWQELRVRRMSPAELGLTTASDPAFTNINYREDLDRWPL